MKNILTHCLTALTLAAFLWACDEEEPPQNLLPVVRTGDATGITRTEATLHGSIEAHRTTVISSVRFRYGTDTSMSEHVTLSPDERMPAAQLTGLVPGTTYYFCLEAGNGYSQIGSEVRQFSTQPNERPTVDSLQVAGQGPTSIILQYRMADDGGSPVTATGCYIREENGSELQIPASLPEVSEGQTVSIQANRLKMHTTYTVCAYAANDIGESRSESLTFRTGEAVYLRQPGSLGLLIGEEDKYHYTTLSFVGPMNGTDLRLLRDMAGCDLYGNPTAGQLTHIDLTDVRITEGGTSYDLSHYTQTDVIGQELFAGCTRLKRVSLPSSAGSMETDAFRNCTSLVTLTIPANMTRLEPSTGCTALQSIEVSAANTSYRSFDGVLYNEDMTALLWYPQGKEDERLELPSTLAYLGDHALRGCHIRYIDLPDGLQEMGQGVFAGSDLEEVSLPDNLSVVPTAAFQHCARLHTVHLGTQTAMLSDYSFEGCPLRHIHIPSAWPPVCGDGVFGVTDYDVFGSCTLHIPAGSKPSYRASDVWGRFALMEESKSE